jgi:ABC-type amino acid transport substrate-binding protein
LLEIAADAAACFTQLRAGTVDAAIMPAVEADGVIESLPPGTAVIEQFALSQLVTLHAVALPADSTSVAKLAALDEALAAMRADGSWLALATGATAPR